MVLSCMAASGIRASIQRLPSSSCMGWVSIRLATTMSPPPWLKKAMPCSVSTCAGTESQPGLVVILLLMMLSWMILPPSRARWNPAIPGCLVSSMGIAWAGILVLNYGLRCPSDFHGVIATGPWLELSFQPPASQVRLGRLMNRISPSFAQNSHLDTRGLSHDQAVVTAYEQDPLVHEKISARLFVSLYETGLWALEHAAEFPLPLLLMHGSLDPITSPKASQEFAKRAGDKVTLKIWNDLFHEIHNEAAQAEVFQFMSDWLDKQLTS